MDNFDDEFSALEELQKEIIIPYYDDTPLIASFVSIAVMISADHRKILYNQLRRDTRITEEIPLTPLNPIFKILGRGKCRRSLVEPTIKDPLKPAFAIKLGVSFSLSIIDLRQPLIFVMRNFIDN
jgi:hypothetical protein